MDNLYEVFLQQLKDIYSAEKQLVGALPKVIQASSTPALTECLSSHLDETKEQLSRLEQISKFLEEDLNGELCRAMKGLIAEASELISEDYRTLPLRDMMIIAIAQKIEHYEIAAYGNAIALARHFGERDVIVVLEKSLGEEKSANNSLTSVTQEYILPACDVYQEEEDVSEELEDYDLSDTPRFIRDL